MKSPFRLAAIDLDETLLGPDHRISPRNACAIREIARLGVTCVIASGRMHEATTLFAGQLGLRAPIISYNGAMIRDTRDNAVWHHLRVPAGPAAEVVKYCREQGLHLNYYWNDRLLVEKRGRWAEQYLRQTGSPMEEFGDLCSLRGSEPTKMILIDSPEVTDGLLEAFRKRFGACLYITKTNPEYLEFMHPAASKGAALELVARRLGIPREEVAAFGDGNNDLPMIQWAGLGVAMAGAKQAVLDAAGYVAPPFEEDGLAAAIEHLFGLARGG